jgi:CheY-like chemotaxis protein
VDDRPASLYTREKVLRGHGFEVVNAQTGAEAMAAARQFHPELILLDIRLPDADGRDLCRSIKADAELGRIPVVLISAYVSGHVAQLESMRWGKANGFISEPVDPASLASLLRSVIAAATRGTADRVRVPAMPHQQAVRDNFHAVKFYRDSRSLAELVAQFLGEGFVARLPGIVLAIPDHCAAILHALHERGFDAERLQADGQLLVYDAEALLAKFMVNGVAEPVRFARTMIPMLERACAGQHHCAVRVYGELVDLLWRADQAIAATRLETLWNQLAQTHEFALLCGYSMGNFYKDAAQTELICAQHTHILSDSSEPASLQ